MVVVVVVVGRSGWFSVGWPYSCGLVAQRVIITPHWQLRFSIAWPSKSEIIQGIPALQTSTAWASGHQNAIRKTGLHDASKALRSLSFKSYYQKPQKYATKMGPNKHANIVAIVYFVINIPIIHNSK